MPIRQGGVLARRFSSWLRDSLHLRTMAPRLSRPIRWKTFLPMSIPITAIWALDLANFVCVGIGWLLAVDPLHKGDGKPPVHPISGQFARAQAFGQIGPIQPQAALPAAKAVQ